MDDGTRSTHWALLVHTSFNVLNHISRLQECQTVLNENVMFSSDSVRQKDPCTIWFACCMCVFKGDNSNSFVGQMACQKLKHWDFLRHHKHDEFQTLHDGTTYWALPVHTTCSDRDHISRSHQCWTVLAENVLVQLSWNFVGLLSKSSR